MLAEIEKRGILIKARMVRLWDYPVEEVWSWLTENDKLQQWFSSLRIEELKQGGRILFDLQDGTFEEMEILACKENAVLEFTWGQDQVRFELTPQGEGTQLVFTEVLNEVNDHTPKDLAGWHVCLDVMEALLEGRPVDFREEDWKERYVEYKELLEAE